MAQGSIRIRCKVCRKAGLREAECRHKERVFNARVLVPGGEVISGTFPTKGEAEKFCVKKLNEVNQGTYKRLDPLTVKEVADKYLACVRPNCSPACYENYKQTIEKYITSVIGSKLIAHVTEDHISKILASCQHKSFSTRQKVTVRLKAIFKIAEKNNALKTNPTLDIPPLKRNHDSKKIQVLTNVMIHALFKLATDPLCNLYYRMSIYTGMRPNELGALEINDIDLDKKTVTVRRVVNWFHTLIEQGSHPKPYYFKESPKTEAGFRVLPLAPELVEKIQIYLIGAKENPHNLLFARPDGDPVRHQIDINKRFFIPHRKKLHATVEFPIDIPYYNLRHTYCSILVEMGVPVKKIQYLMGHEDFETTMNIYAKMRPENNDSLGEELGQFLSEPQMKVS